MYQTYRAHMYVRAKILKTPTDGYDLHSGTDTIKVKICCPKGNGGSYDLDRHGYDLKPNSPLLTIGVRF